MNVSELNDTEVYTSESLEDSILLLGSDSDGWICDTGSTCHLVNDDSHIYDVEEVSKKNNVGNGKRLQKRKKRLSLITLSTQNQAT